MSKDIRIVIVDDDPFITLALRTILQEEEGLTVCATGSCGKDAAALYRAHHPDILLSDIRMPYDPPGEEDSPASTRSGERKVPSMSSAGGEATLALSAGREVASAHSSGWEAASDLSGGLEAAEEVLNQDPQACVLLLTTFLDDAYIIRALRIGVSGYLLKQDYSHLAAAIRAAAEGQSVFGQEITAKMPLLMAQSSDKSRPNESGAALSAQEAAGLGLTEREYELCGLVAEGYSNKEISEKIFLSEGTVRNYLTTVLEKLQLRDRTQLAVFYLTGKR